MSNELERACKNRSKSWIESDAWQNVNKRKYLRRLASKRLRVLLKREEDNA